MRKRIKLTQTYTLAFVGESLWRCVPDGDDPFSKVYDANRGKLIYTGNKQSCLVDIDGRVYKYTVELPS